MTRRKRRINEREVLGEEMMELSDEVFVQLLRDPELPRGGLSRLEFLVLRELSERASSSVKQLRKRFGMVPSALTRIINRLQGYWPKPLVDRALGLRDRRLTILKITRSGRTAVRRHLKQRLELWGPALKMLTLREVTGALKFIRLMREAFEKQWGGYNGE